jgi:hypothetical protein
MSSAAALALRAQVVALGPSAETAGQTPAKEADVAVVIGVRTPGMRLEAADTVTLVRIIYDPTGKAGPPFQQKIDVAPPPPGNDDLRYEVFQRIKVPPGRWELRMNASSARLDTSGTVYAEFEVPDFSRRNLALTGVLLGQPVPEGRSDVLAGLTPIVPTTARDFAPSDQVTAYLRVHQGGVAAPVPVTMGVQVLDTSDQRVFESSSQIAASAFDGSRSAPFSFVPPFEKLTRGQYLLSISASLPDGTKTRTDVVFRIR